MEYKLFSYVYKSFESGTIMFFFCWCFFLRVCDEKNENATFLKHFRADIFEDANFPYSLAADVNGCVRNRDDVTFIWKNCVIITHCFFKACSILYYFLFWKGTHTFSNENHRDTWGRGLNHDSPVCVFMSFRSDLVWKTLNGENWTKSLFFPSSKKLSITCAKHCRFRYTVWPVMLGDIGLIAE